MNPTKLPQAFIPSQKPTNRSRRSPGLHARRSRVSTDAQVSSEEIIGASGSRSQKLDPREVSFFQTKKTLLAALLGLTLDRNLCALAQTTLIMLRLQSPSFVPRVAHIQKFLRVSERTCQEVLRNLRLAGYCELRTLAIADHSGGSRVTGSHYVFYDSPQSHLVDRDFVKAVVAGADPGFKRACRAPRKPAIKAIKELDTPEAKVVAFELQAIPEPGELEVVETDDYASIPENTACEVLNKDTASILPLKSPKGGRRKFFTFPRRAGAGAGALPR